MIVVALLLLLLAFTLVAWSTVLWRSLSLAIARITIAVTTSGEMALV